MNLLDLQPLTPDLIPAAVALDQLSLGGLWTAAGYQREVESDNAVLLALLQHPAQEEDARLTADGSQDSSQWMVDGSLPPTLHSPSPANSAFAVRRPPSTVHPASAANPPAMLALGCVWMILEEAHLTLLTVHPDYRQQGLGQWLLVELIAAAWARRMAWVTLEVRASNQQAIALYQKLDFRQVGRRKRYYENPPEDALILWRSGLQEENFSTVLAGWRATTKERLYQSGWQFCRDQTPEPIQLTRGPGSVSG